MTEAGCDVPHKEAQYLKDLVTRFSDWAGEQKRVVFSCPGLVDVRLVPGSQCTTLFPNAAENNFKSLLVITCLIRGTAPDLSDSPALRWAHSMPCACGCGCEGTVAREDGHAYLFPQVDESEHTVRFSTLLTTKGEPPKPVAELLAGGKSVLVRTAWPPAVKGQVQAPLITAVNPQYARQCLSCQKKCEVSGGMKGLRTSVVQRCAAKVVEMSCGKFIDKYAQRYCRNGWGQAGDPAHILMLQANGKDSESKQEGADLVRCKPKSIDVVVEQNKRVVARVHPPMYKSLFRFVSRQIASFGSLALNMSALSHAQSRESKSSAQPSGARSSGGFGQYSLAPASSKLSATQSAPTQTPRKEETQAKKPSKSRKSISKSTKSSEPATRREREVAKGAKKASTVAPTSEAAPAGDAEDASGWSREEQIQLEKGLRAIPRTTSSRQRLDDIRKQYLPHRTLNQVIARYKFVRNAVANKKASASTNAPNTQTSVGSDGGETRDAGESKASSNNDSDGSDVDWSALLGTQAQGEDANLKGTAVACVGMVCKNVAGVLPVSVVVSLLCDNGLNGRPQNTSPQRAVVAVGKLGGGVESSSVGSGVARSFAQKGTSHEAHLTLFPCGGCGPRKQSQEGKSGKSLVHAATFCPQMYTASVHVSKPKVAHEDSGSEGKSQSSVPGTQSSVEEIGGGVIGTIWMSSPTLSVEQVVSFSAFAVCISCFHHVKVEVTVRNPTVVNCHNCHAQLSLRFPLRQRVGFHTQELTDQSPYFKELGFADQSTYWTRTQKRKDPRHKRRDQQPKGIRKVSLRSLGITPGSPLPRNGACRHMKKSYRWVRYRCCGVPYPCDKCHDEVTNNNRYPQPHKVVEAGVSYVCGRCAVEQNFANKSCRGCGFSFQAVRTQFWEGGEGCRDQSMMSKGDKKKFAGRNKTVSRRHQARKNQ